MASMLSSEAMAKARTQSKGALARENIIKAAQECVAKTSFEEASLGDIARKAGTTQTNILYHFKNKKILLAEVIQSVLNHGRAFIDRPLDPSLSAFERMREYIYRQIDWAAQFRDDAAVITYLYYLSTREEDYKKLYSQIQSTAQQRILEYLLAGKREKLFSYSESDEAMASHLHNYLLGSIINFVTTSAENEKPIRVKKHWDKILKLFLLEA